MEPAKAASPAPPAASAVTAVTGQKSINDFQPPSKEERAKLTQPQKLPSVEKPILTDEQRASGLVTAIKRSGIIVNMVEGGRTEQETKEMFPHCFDIETDNPADLFAATEELDAGDTCTFALYGSRLYYFPRMIANPYHDPLKRQQLVDKIKKEEKKQLKASRQKGNFNQRLLALEQVVSKFLHMDDHMQELNESCARLIKVKESREIDKDQILALQQWIQNIARDTDQLKAWKIKTEPPSTTAAAVPITASDIQQT